MFTKLLSSAVSSGSTDSLDATQVEQAAQDAAESLSQWWENGGLITTLVTAAVVSVIIFIVLKLMQHFLKKWLEGNLRIFYRLIYVLVIVIGVMVVMMTIDPLRDIGYAILASSGIAAVILGLAAQQTLGNLFSGISISIGKPFLVGEYVELLNTNPPVAGTVKEITLRHTKITDTSNKIIVVPNSILDKELIRTSHSLDSADISSYLSISLSYKSDIDRAMQIIREIADAHEDSLDVRTEAQKAQGVPKTVIYVSDLNGAAVELRVSIWTKDSSTGLSVLSDLRYAIKKAFDKEGIEPPYPWQNVTMENSGQEKH